jgi:hypothetical protein
MPECFSSDRLRRSRFAALRLGVSSRSGDLGWEMGEDNPVIAEEWITAVGM